MEFKGEFGGIAPTGKKVLYRISDGLIVQHWVHWDMKAVAGQLTN